MEQGKLDIVVGGQYGDEGKGAVAAYLATHKDYGFTVRVGGYNAEHRYFYKGKEYTGRVLPCGLVNEKIRLYLGAGHLFSIEALEKEIADMGIDKSRVFIDENAGIVTEEHMNLSASADRGARGGTTGRGAGKAAAHKVLRDGKFKVAKDYPYLVENFNVVNIARMIREDLNAGVNGLLEGSQGALLAIDHGTYPFCCAKNVTPAGVVAEAGTDMYAVRDTYAVYRTYPMRVPGNSGPTPGAEVPWPELEKRLGYELPEKLKRQTLADGTKGDYERMFEWSDIDFIKSLTLCTPTHIAITFIDWLTPADADKKTWDSLSPATIQWIGDVVALAEQTLGRKVSPAIIKTGAAEDSIILG